MLFLLLDMENICKVSRSAITFWKHLSELFLIKQLPWYGGERLRRTSNSLFSILRKGHVAYFKNPGFSKGKHVACFMSRWQWKK
jgi:hypothetical protein